MSNTPAQPAKDWVSGIQSYGLVWGLPLGAMALGLVMDVPIRTVVWTLGLAWMGTACIWNARRCGRTHCRFTGPFYLAMIIPVLALGSGFVPAGLLGWIAVGLVIVVGSKAIWWWTERAWGRFS